MVLPPPPLADMSTKNVGSFFGRIPSVATKTLAKVCKVVFVIIFFYDYGGLVFIYMVSSENLKVSVNLVSSCSEAFSIFVNASNSIAITGKCRKCSFVCPCGCKGL